MLNKTFLLNDANWSGGYYELSLEFHPSGNDERILTALETVCKIPRFIGPWEEKENYFKSPCPLPTKMNENGVMHYYGILKITEEIPVGCLIYLCRIENESDWLDISIPMSMLEKIYPVKYELTVEQNPWITELNDFLISLAEKIYIHSPFEMGMIGYEVSGYVNHMEITKDHLENGIVYILPTTFVPQLKPKNEGIKLNDKLLLFKQF